MDAWRLRRVLRLGAISILSIENTFYLLRAHYIYSQHILSTENSFYL